MYMFVSPLRFRDFVRLSPCDDLDNAYSKEGLDPRVSSKFVHDQHNICSQRNCESIGTTRNCSGVKSFSASPVVTYNHTMLEEVHHHYPETHLMPISTPLCVYVFHVTIKLSSFSNNLGFIQSMITFLYYMYDKKFHRTHYILNF